MKNVLVGLPPDVASDLEEVCPPRTRSHFIVLAIREKLARHPVAQRLGKERDDSIARKEAAGEELTPEEEAWWRHKLITSPPIDFFARRAINEHAKRVEEAKKLAPRILDGLEAAGTPVDQWIVEGSHDNGPLLLEVIRLAEERRGAEGSDE